MVWKPEAGHPHEVGIRERQRHAQTSTVRLLDVADFPGQHIPGAIALFLPLLR